MNEVLLNYGVLGVAVIALSGAVGVLYKTARKDTEAHKKERREIIETMTKAIERNTDAINNNSNLVTSMKTMLETIIMQKK